MFFFWIFASKVPTLRFYRFKIENVSVDEGFCWEICCISDGIGPMTSDLDQEQSTGSGHGGISIYIISFILFEDTIVCLLM